MHFIKRWKMYLQQQQTYRQQSIIDGSRAYIRTTGSTLLVDYVKAHITFVAFMSRPVLQTLRLLIHALVIFVVVVICFPYLMTFDVNDHANILDEHDRPRQYIYSSRFVIILLIFVASCCIPSTKDAYMHHKRVSYDKVSPTATSHPNKPPVTVITINRIDWKILQGALNTYRTETNVALEQLSMTLEVVISEEKKLCLKFSHRWELSDHIRAKILRLSELYDQDMEILERALILPFFSVQALPDAMIAVTTETANANDDFPVIDTEVTSKPTADTTTGSRNFTWWSEKHSRAFTNKAETYDSIRQVIAHLTRDWSAVEGAPIRDSIYSWCIEQLQLHHFELMNGPVLVPGAGLGRLAWEISRNFDSAVEAIESSICMTAAAHTILNMKMKNTFVLHPFAADSFSNEVDNEARYDAIQFPDINPSIGPGSLSYTVGTFSYDSMQHCSNQYGAVVTSFFIDTATTVYDLISTIAMVLSHGGLWVNVGPLQWHINNQVPVAVNELRMIIENFRDQMSGRHLFQILQWSVDEHPIRYRNHGGRHRSTYYDGYCPLRFVIRKV